MGRRHAAVVDPGPNLAAHVDAVAAAVQDAESVVLLLTHGHADHSGAAAVLAERLGARVLGAWGAAGAEGEGAGGGPPPGLFFRRLTDGDSVPTDAGELIARSTPGHAREHFAFHWPAQAAAFVGDLMLGRGDTTWVGEYPGCVADYLAALDRIDVLDTRLLLPAHGGPVHDPTERVARFRAHRLERVDQVRGALAANPGMAAEELFVSVYGRAIPPDLAPAARLALAALVEHVRAPEADPVPPPARLLRIRGS